MVGDSDPLVWTSSAVKAELARVRGVLDAVNKDMSRAVDDKKITSDEWKTWFDGTYTPGHKLVDESSSLWGSNVSAARLHEQAALKWRELVQSRGGATSGPKNLGRKSDDSKIPPYLGVTAIVVGGAILYLLAKDKL